MSLLGLGVCLADTQPQLTAADYARAERFLSWNKDRYVINADIQHHWIGTRDRFWYSRTNTTGEKEFVVVDAVSGERAAAFDQAKIAAALAKATKTPITPGQLPFSSFRYPADESAIEFKLDEYLWTCELDGGECRRAQGQSGGYESLSPDGKWAAFVRDYNLWIRPVDGGRAFPLTTDGVEHYSYATSSGYSAPVSGERQRRPATPHVLWSPDSRRLASHRLDERQVQDAFLIQSIPEDGSARPKLYTFRYAMVGDEHVPLLQPIVFDVAGRRRIPLRTDALICSISTSIERRETWWSADSKSVYFLNRDRFSKSVSFHRANSKSGAVQILAKESSDTIVQTNANNVFDVPLVRTLSNGDFIWYSQRDGWGHLYYYSADGELSNRVTSGEWVVRGVVHVDEAQKRLYFMASGREPGRDPYEQRLYSVSFDGSDMRLLTPEEADHEWPHKATAAASASEVTSEAERARFSPSGRYFVDSYSRPDLPPVFVLRAADGRLIRQLEQADISKLREGGYTPVEPFQVLAADGRTAIYGNLFRPSKFDPGSKYAVIDAGYPGPQTTRVVKSFTAALFDGFEAQTLADLGFIVVTIDGRGTPHRSKAFLDHSYGKLGDASDLEDHIAGLQQLARRHSFMDLDRVGIDGASGGGFMAARAILAYPDFYKVAVAAEGNHDQRSYLAPWGETYNGPLQSSDYSAAATPPLAANLKGKLLLMHGELDDNVPPALTMRLADALIKANRDFDLLIMPNANHAAFLTSGYFIRRKWDYFVRNLQNAEPPSNYSIQTPQ